MSVKRVIAGLAVSLSLAACSEGPTPEADAPAAAPVAEAVEVAKGDPVEGLRIAKHVGCTGCHSEDGRGGGFDITVPTGDRLVAPNLTERRAIYDDAGLVALLREGKTHDGHRPLGMPVFMFQHLSDRELRDLTAWLRELPAVDNPGLATSTLTPATVQQLADGSFPYDDDLPDPDNVPPADRPTEPMALGRHIANTSCGECHGRDLQGWGDGDPTPSLVLVNKAYSPEHFARLMKTGVAANGQETATGRMSGIARHRFSVLTDAEVVALKLYLDSR